MSKNHPFRRHMSTNLVHVIDNGLLPITQRRLLSHRWERYRMIMHESKFLLISLL